MVFIDWIELKKRLIFIVKISYAATKGFFTHIHQKMKIEIVTILISLTFYPYSQIEKSEIYIEIFRSVIGTEQIESFIILCL